METPYKREDLIILPFDFADLDLVTKSIDLLNSNSGKNKHNYQYWKWRFDDNPFAVSYGWYAKEKKSNELAAILLFWPWRFEANNKEYLFYQAINGITNKKFRNLGIFLELNNRAIDFFDQKNIPLYGIPNVQSYPTYQKLEWITLEKINPYFVPLSPFKSLLKYFFAQNNDASELLKEHLLRPYDFINTEIVKLKTKWTKEVIDWRFVKHPLFSYYLYQNNGGSIVFKIKKRGKLSEAQLILSCNINRAFLKNFRKFLREHKIDILSYYGTNTLLFELIKKSILKLKNKNSLYFVLKNTPELDGVPFMIELAERDTT